MALPQFRDEQALVKFVIQAKLPDWQKDLFKKNAEAVRVHSQGHIFYKIDRLFPNEHPESKAHRVLAFESVTEASFGRAANNVTRIFKNSSYTVEASEKTVKVSTDFKYQGQNFYNWFLDQWVNMALKNDPNARFVIYPKEYVALGNPLCEFIESCRFKKIDEDTVVFVSERESEVDYDLKEMKVDSEVFYDQSISKLNIMETKKNTYTPWIEATIKRPVYHVFFKGVGFYRVEKLKEADNYQVDFYPFSVDFMPVLDVGGDKGDKDVNKSFLHPFVAFGNLALLQHSQHTAVNFTYSFPRMSEIQTPCDAVGCADGWILLDEDAPDFTEYPDGKKKCSRCGGSGYTRNQTPYKIYVKKFDPQGMEGEQKHLEVPDVQYYTPDVSILTYSKQEWRDYLEMAETAVYIQQRIKTGNVEAAASKEIDREDLYSFLARVGQVYFSRLRFALQSLENYHVASPSWVNVEVPYSYAILSEGEAFAALKDILASNVPVMLKASQVESFINKFVSQSSPIRRFIDVLKIVDPLLYYTNSEIGSFKASNIITAEQFANHVFAYPTLQRMFNTDKNIFLQDNQAIIDKVIKELEAFKPIPEPDIKTKFLQGQ